MMTDQSLVFVVDDDASIRASLESLFRSVGHGVRSFPTAQAFLDAERPEIPACLVLDIRLPGKSGIELQRELATLGLPIPIVFMTGHGDIPMSVAAMKAGAVEFLQKPFRDQDLLDAVHRGLDIDRGRRAVAADLALLRDRFRQLTAREREIMTMVAAGRLNKQIAADLDLSEVTVKVHRANVMRKMQAPSLVDLVRIADRLSLDTGKQ